MANLQPKIRVITQASPPSTPPLLIHEEVRTTFDEFVKKLTTELQGVSLTLKQSYISKYHYLAELRDTHKEEWFQNWEATKRTVPAIVKNKTQVPTQEEFTEIENYFNELFTFLKNESAFNALFNPPRPRDTFAYISSSTQLDPAALNAPVEKVIVHNIPGQTALTDLRRTGRLILVNETDNLKSDPVQKFLLNNGPLYGLIPYGNFGIYYYGLTQLKAATKGKSAIELYRILARYRTAPANLSDLTVTAEAIQKSNFNPVPPAPPSVIPAVGELSYDYHQVVKNLDGTFGPALANNSQSMQPGRCSAVKINNRTYHMHTGAEPQFANRKRTPLQIVLHHTAGWGQDAIGTLMTVGGCRAISKDNMSQYGATSPTYEPYDKYNWYPRSGIHWSVDGHGSALAGINEAVQSIHGNNWNTYGIGIEIGMPGYLQLINGRLYTDALERYVKAEAGIPTVGNPVRSYKFGYNKDHYIDWQIVNLGFDFEGHRYSTEMTDRQVEALEKLIRDIFGRWPHIQRAVTGRNQWIDVWGLSGKPAPGSSVIPALQPSDSPGIKIHATGNGIGGDNHSDTGPTPKMVAMLNRLGYNEG